MCGVRRTLGGVERQDGCGICARWACYTYPSLTGLRTGLANRRWSTARGLAVLKGLYSCGNGARALLNSFQGSSIGECRKRFFPLVDGSLGQRLGASHPETCVVDLEVGKGNKQEVLCNASPAGSRATRQHRWLTLVLIHANQAGRGV